MKTAALNLKTQSNWHIVYTCPNREKKIYKELSRLKIEAYLPIQKIFRQWSDRKKIIESPLFPNYIFVNITRYETWMVLSVTGVVRFLYSDGIPAVLKENDLETIKKLSSVNCEVLSKKDITNVGEKVTIVEGPFAGLEGIVLKIKGSQRFIIEFKTMGRIVCLDLPEIFFSKSSRVGREVAEI